MTLPDDGHGGASATPAALIFVVDDNATLAEFAATVLKAAGYDARDFDNPRAALRAITDSKRKPDLLVTDFDMGDITGLDLIQSSQKICPGLKTILLSGTIDDAIVERNPGVVHRFLGKPYRPPELTTIVEQLLRA